MKGIIIFKGKYGATEQYANWCSSELDMLVRKAEEINREQLNDFGFLIIGTSVYIGKLQIQNWIKENHDFITGKKIFLFQVAGTPAADVAKRESYNVQNIPGDILVNAESFYLPGRLVMGSLSWFDRFKLRMGARMTKDKNNKEKMLNDYDDVKKEQIYPLIKAVNDFRSKYSDRKTVEFETASV